MLAFVMLSILVKVSEGTWSMTCLATEFRMTYIRLLSVILKCSASNNNQNTGLSDFKFLMDHMKNVDYPFKVIICLDFQMSIPNPNGSNNE